MGWPETALDAAAAMTAGMAALGCIYALVIARLVARFGRRPIAAPLGEPPGISVLKPLCGLEPGLEAALATFCDQDYSGPVQIVFGVQRAADPAIAVVERLSARFPAAAIDLVVDATLHGANRKVSNLVNMAARAVHPIIMVSDSDIVAPRDCLARMVAELGQPGVAAVTSLYHGTAVGEGLWPRLEALGIDARFLPDIIAGISFGMAKPCFGSAIAMRAETLAAIGGFERVADELADDFKLGTALRERGTVAVPASTVGHLSSDASLSELWHHDLRWQRTVRSLHPAGYLGSVVTHPVPFALAALALSGFGGLGIAAVAAALAGRMLLYRTVAATFRLTPQGLALLVLRDLLSFAVFVWSFTGSAVSWRGNRYRVAPDGQLLAEPPASDPPAPDPFRRPV
jgi:ceramide glucosyltransferase